MGLSEARTKAAMGVHRVPELGGPGEDGAFLRRKVAKMTEKRNFGDVCLENHCEICRYRHIGVEPMVRAAR